jgi:hypothetical protein
MLGGFKAMGEGGAIGSPSCVARAINAAPAALGRKASTFLFGPPQLLDVLAV